MAQIKQIAREEDQIKQITLEEIYWINRPWRKIIDSRHTDVGLVIDFFSIPTPKFENIPFCLFWNTSLHDRSPS